MYLGDYYDSVMSEAGLTKEAGVDVEQIKVAEVIDDLAAKGTQFESEKDAEAAVAKIVEDDYAEKVANVINEFDIDKVAFESDEDKVAAAMEIVDGWEQAVVSNA